MVFKTWNLKIFFISTLYLMDYLRYGQKLSVKEKFDWTTNFCFWRKNLKIMAQMRTNIQ
jgi:hypothetical protein